jgi:quinone-reactive Ni/Fe-hydrogenase small subunit/[NiFe] hydrogenase small subunit
VGISEAIGVKTINIAGCPPNAVNFTGTVLHYLLFGTVPPLDSLGRPLWAYGKRIHDFCERRPHYDAGEFVEEWGDAGAIKGWCLYKVGCKGPYTFANCSKVRFNDGISWPVMAGHGCIGCTEPGFWDTMAPLEKSISDQTIGGGEKTVDRIGAVLTGVAVAGVAAHAGATAIVRKARNKDDRMNAEEEKHD